MVFRPAAFGIELVAHFEHVVNTAEHAVCVMHTKGPGPSPTPVPHADLVSALSNFRGIWTNHLMQDISQDAHVVRWTARDISQDGGEVVEDTTAVAGGFNQHPFPGTIAIVLSWRTGKSGRSYRGRTYLPFIPDTAKDTSDNNRIASGYLGTLRTHATNFMNAATGNGIPLQVLSGQHNGVQLNPRIFTPITSVTVDGKFDHQNRRGRVI